MDELFASPADSRNPTWLELERILTLGEVEQITGISRDTLERHHSDRIVRLSPRRRGMKLRHALAITSGRGLQK
jgi:predicted DNA-binding transcriptional regulator AlpA